MKSIIILSILISKVALSATFSQETEEVRRRLGQSKEIRYNYCIEGTLTCRTLVLLSDKRTDRPLDMFYNNFVSSERAVALSGYFLKNVNRSSYRAYTDSLFDGQVNIDTINDWDKSIRVTFDRKGFPTLHNLNLKNLGTTLYTIAELKFNQEASTIRGIRYDSSNPNFSEKVEIIYRRARN